MTTDQLLRESVDEAQERERGAFSGGLPAAGPGVVLFGAGRLGRKVLGALRASGTEPLGFADNDPALAGRTVEGVAVLPLADSVSRWGTDALYVVTIFRPLDGQGVDQRLAVLRALGCHRTATFLEPGWRHPGILPHFGADRPSTLLAHAQRIAHVGTLWEDPQSREVFRQQLSWRLRGNFSECSPPVPGQYFPADLMSPLPHERIVDGGAFDGDTLRCIPWGFDRAWAFEPDPLNAARLRSRADSRVTLFETALGLGHGSCRFEALGSTASSRQESGTVEVAVERLDDVLSGEVPTFVKLDVEGDELDALQGAARTLDRAQPVVAVCIYHKTSHLWSVPLFLSEALPRHTLHLRSHEYDGFELVAYAIPAGRRP